MALSQCFKFIREDFFASMKKIPILIDGNTYLHLAAKTGQTEMFETILNTESDKNPRNDYCTTPFHLICSNGNIIFAELLLRKLMPTTNTTSDIYDLVMIIHDNNLNLKSNFKDTGYSLSEAHILASINPKYNDRLFL